MVVFGFILGLVATIAEPNVQVLAYQVDTVSGAVIPKNALILPLLWEWLYLSVWPCYG